MIKIFDIQKVFDFSQFECDGERNQETETILLARSSAMASNSCRFLI